MYSMKRSQDQDPAAFLASRKRYRRRSEVAVDDASGARLAASRRGSSVAQASSVSARRRQRPSDGPASDGSESVASRLTGGPASSQGTASQASRGGASPPTPLSQRVPSQATDGIPQQRINASMTFPSSQGDTQQENTVFPDLPQRELSRCSLSLKLLPSRARLWLAGLGTSIANDPEMLRTMEEVIEGSAATARRLGGVHGTVYGAFSERMRQMLLLLFDAVPHSSAEQGLLFGYSDKQHTPLLAIPTASVRADAVTGTTAARTPGALAAAASWMAAATAAVPTEDTGRVMQLRDRDLTEAALVTREAARALVEEQRRQQAEDIVEIWPLRRAGSVHMAPCLLIEAMPALDLLEAEGMHIPEASAGDIIWAPLWCAEALCKRRFANIMLPPFLRRGQLSAYLKAEERQKRVLEPLPVFFFEAARLLLFNPLVQPIGCDADGGKEKGLVLQLWDRRQSKIAAILTASGHDDQVIRVDHIQPSETYILSAMRMDTPLE